MISIRPAGAVALALLLAACGPRQNATTSDEAKTGTPGPAAIDQVYSGTGTIKSITDDRLAIAHGPVFGIGWPAMTMTFAAPPGMAKGLRAGDSTDFSFRQNGSVYVLTVKPR